MTRFVIRRLAWALLTALVASIVAFVLFWMVPNVDPSYKLGGGAKGTDVSRGLATDIYGLDDPYPLQYARLMEGIFSGDVECYYASTCGNVREAFFDRLPVTFWLVAGAALLAIAGGMGLALLCVRHRGTIVDRAISRAAVVLYSVPSLIVAALLWSYAAYRWDIFPTDGYVGLTDNPLDWAWHLALPWIAAALPFVGAYTQVMRAGMLDVLDQDWVRAARAKGISEQRVLRRHVLRNSLVPSVSLWGLDFSHAFGGFALYVETIFSLPGVGSLTATTLRAYDLPPIVALAVWLALVVVITSAVVDIAVRGLEPRTRRAAA